MSNYCSCCGLPIPEGQNTCSMCYGDIGHGNDGYYEEWARQQMQDEEERMLQDKLEQERYEEEKSKEEGE